MLSRTDRTTLSKALRVLLACTVFVMYGAMLRIYRDTQAPHDMHPGLDSCRHIKDLARHQYDGEYLLRSDVVAQLALLWSQSDCSKYAALLSDSPNQAAYETRENSGESEHASRHTAQDKDQNEQTDGPLLNSADSKDGFSGASGYNPVLVEELPVALVGVMTARHAMRELMLSSRSDDVPSPPPRAVS